VHVCWIGTEAATGTLKQPSAYSNVVRPTVCTTATVFFKQNISDYCQYHFLKPINRAHSFPRAAEFGRCRGISVFPRNFTESHVNTEITWQRPNSVSLYCCSNWPVDFSDAFSRSVCLLT